MLPKRLQKKLEERRENKSLRKLGEQNDIIDFSSNDYLGFSKNKTIYNRVLEILDQKNLKANGATGSRLLSGNHLLYALTETQIAIFHNVEAALIYNSGYDANLGFFSSVLQRGDIIFYDELCHASIRDGIRMSNATGIKFKHNDLKNLRILVEKKTSNSLPLGEMSALADREGVEIYVVTESVFSMDGDSPDLRSLAEFCRENQIHLIVDEAHAIGVVGNKGVGLVQELGIENEIFARIVTFGKALGCHGAAILGSEDLKQYLVNFSRSLVYTTGLPPHSIATIQASYEYLKISKELEKLNSNIALLRSIIKKTGLSITFTESNSAIQSCIVIGNSEVKELSNQLRKAGFDVKPILSPTVPAGQERLRICLHSFNTEEQIIKMITIIKNNLISSPF